MFLRHNTNCVLVTLVSSKAASKLARWGPGTDAGSIISKILDPSLGPIAACVCNWLLEADHLQTNYFRPVHGSIYQTDAGGHLV
jgi:hypothetical protein